MLSRHLGDFLRAELAIRPINVTVQWSIMRGDARARSSCRRDAAARSWPPDPPRAGVVRAFAVGRLGGACAPCVRYFIGEKSVGSMNTDSTLLTILPLASESFCTFCHSGSLPNSFQFCLAASRLACAMT